MSTFRHIKKLEEKDVSSRKLNKKYLNIVQIKSNQLLISDRNFR